MNEQKNKHHHVYQDLWEIKFPGVTIIQSECIEHGEIDGDYVTPGCGLQILNYRTRQKPISDVVLT